MRTRRVPDPSQRGGIVLAVVGLLLLAALLAATLAQRGLLFEHLATHNQYRAAQAFEAAEAGIDWTLAQLNSGAPLDDRCRASSDTGAAPFAERFLAGPDARGHWKVRHDTTSGQPLRLSCASTPQGFSCHCAQDEVAEATGSTQHFSAHFEDDGTPGQVRLLSTGCSGLGADCAAGSDAAFSAHAQVTLARLSPLTRSPTAALTVLGDVVMPDAPVELSHRAQASGGLTLRSGGAVDASRLQLRTVAGAPPWTSVVDHDAALASLQPADFFAGLFGMSAQQWRQQPDVRRVDCHAPCDEALRQALGTPLAHPRLWLDGGLQLATSQVLGSARMPVLLVVDGPVRFDAPVRIHGLVHGRSAQWSDFAGAEVQGALTVETGWSAQGTTRITHDAALLTRLREHGGTWARVAGSWRDLP